MKTLRRLGVALVFTLALAIPTLAGEIHTTVTSPPPPPQTITSGGDIQTTVAGQEETCSSEAAAADAVAEIALNLLHSVLSLF